MNIWSQKTLELVTKKNYLDQLQKIYVRNSAILKAENQP